MVHAQEPTCTDLRIRSTQDTHKIFYAIQKGTLKMVTRRLDADERLALRSGCVYAWEERGPHSEITGLGIERFTEGRRWTPSRVRDEFLFYYERYMPPPDATGSGSPADAKPPRDWEPLVKQTYSVWVDTDNGRRKWHITAYFTQGTIDQLRCVDDIPGVGDLVVPEGHFKSTRVGKRAKTDESKGESSKSSVSRTYAAFPSPYSTNSPAVESPSVLMYEPYRDTSSDAQHNSFYHPQNHTDDRSHSRSSPLPHQDRSSASLSPPLPNSRMQYGGQTPSYNGVLQGDLKSSRMDVPAVSSHPSHSHPSDYRSHPPLALSSAMGPMNENIQVQRGLPPAVSSPAQVMNNHNPQMHTAGYNMYPVQQAQQQTYHSTAMSHNGMPAMHQEYMSPAPDPMSMPTHTSETPRTLPPLHIPYEEPYMYASPLPTEYQPILPTHQPVPVASPPPPRDSHCRPLALAPLHTLNRSHPYKRERQDDKALRLLQQSTSVPPPL